MAKETMTLAGVLDQLNKDHGAGTAMLLGTTPLPEVEVIPSGSIGLDEALGVGGIPRGRVVELYGPESSGKTTIALRAVGQAQKLGLTAAYIDAEHAIDPEWAATLGVDTDKLVLSQPDNGEQALEVAEFMARSKLFGILVIDSVAALVPKAEIEGAMGDSHVGLQARLMSQALRKLTGALAGSNTTALFINQLRQKVGVFFGSPETTTGGMALKFYSSVRLDVRRIETLGGLGNAHGIRIRVKVVKNKCAPPFKQAELDLLFGTGFSRSGELFDLGVERGLITKSGVWYSFNGGEQRQGKEAFRAWLDISPDTADALEKAITAAGPPDKKPGRAKLTGSDETPWDGNGEAG